MVVHFPRRARRRMKQLVRLDEPDANVAPANQSSPAEGLRAVQVIDLDLLPGAGPRGYSRSSSSCTLGRTRRRMKRLPDEEACKAAVCPAQGSALLRPGLC